MMMRWIWVLGVLAATGCAAQEAPQPEAPPPAPAPLPTLEPVAAAPEPPPPAPPEPKLKLSVFTSSPEGFLVTSTLVSGATDAVLIDAQFTLGDAKKLAETVKASGKKLTTVYVTHSHPDHYFGFGPLKEAFPEAKLVALPATIAGDSEDLGRQGQAVEAHLQGRDHRQAGRAGAAGGYEPRARRREARDRRGRAGDEAQSSYVWIPSLGAVIASDTVYDDVFPWTAETTPSSARPGPRRWTASKRARRSS